MNPDSMHPVIRAAVMKMARERAAKLVQNRDCPIWGMDADEVAQIYVLAVQAQLRRLNGKERSERFLNEVVLFASKVMGITRGKIIEKSLTAMRDLAPARYRQYRTALLRQKKMGGKYVKPPEASVQRDLDAIQREIASELRHRSLRCRWLAARELALEYAIKELRDESDRRLAEIWLSEEGCRSVKGLAARMGIAETTFRSGRWAGFVSRIRPLVRKNFRAIWTKMG